MSVDIEISSIFARYANNQTNVKATGDTVGECLRDLARQYPDFGKMLLEKNGELSASFDIFVNGENAYPNPMTWPVKDGNKINVVMIIHGG